MKKGEMAKKAKKYTIWIVALSITGLVLLSFIPWISSAEHELVKEELYFNFDMMKNSDNQQIRDLGGSLNLINILLWALVILGLLSFLGVTIHASGKFSPVGLIMLLVGCTTLLCSFFVVYFQFNILRSIGGIDTISSSAKERTSW